MAKNKKTVDAKVADKKSKTKKDSNKKKDGNKKNPFVAIGKYFRGVYKEGRKVIWPSAKETFRNTLIVIVVIFLIGIVVFAVDKGLTSGIEGLKNLTTTTQTTEAATEDTTVETTVAETEAETTKAE